MHTLDILTTFVASGAIGLILVLWAERLRTSPIGFLLLAGVAFGPEGLELIQPKLLGEGLNVLINLAVGIILFEGGLTLDIRGYRKLSKEIHGVLTRGVLVTWLGTAVVLWFLLRFDFPFCLLAASLIIVTGPTVVGPLLHRIRIKENLRQILYWEAVLIDPIGVFLALLSYEWILTAGNADAYLNFFFRLIAGLALGGAFGAGLNFILKANWLPEERINIFMLTSAMVALTLSNLIVQESGLLTVTLAGLYLGWKKSPGLVGIIAYKTELKDFLIGLLFMLLAANLHFNNFYAYGWVLLVALLLVAFLIRPFNILLSTLGSDLTWREKSFLSWVAPRGIVAASMASLFTVQLSRNGFVQADFLETFTYTIIAGTVLFQSITAKGVAGLLQVLQTRPRGWLFIGSNPITRAVAHFVARTGEQSLLLDSNPREVKQAQREGLKAICENALQLELEQYIELADIGHILAATPNEELNRLVCQRWGQLIPEARLFFWPGEEKKSHGVPKKAQACWSDFSLKSLQIQTEAKELFTCEDIHPLPWKNNQGHGLFFVHQERLSPIPPTAREGEVKALTLTPFAVGLLGPMREDWIVFSQAKSLYALYKELLSLLDEEQYPLAKEVMLEELMLREREYSSLIGKGVALPHCYDSYIEESILLIGILKQPLFTEYSQEPIELVFLLISPAGHPETHLQMLSKLARFAIQEENRAALLQAQSLSEAYGILEKGHVKQLEPKA